MIGLSSLRGWLVPASKKYLKKIWSEYQRRWQSVWNNFAKRRRPHERRLRGGNTNEKTRVSSRPLVEYLDRHFLQLVRFKIFPRSTEHHDNVMQAAPWPHCDQHPQGDSDLRLDATQLKKTPQRSATSSGEKHPRLVISRAFIASPRPQCGPVELDPASPRLPLSYLLP